jgi:hypothetical protein
MDLGKEVTTQKGTPEEVEAQAEAVAEAAGELKEHKGNFVLLLDFSEKTRLIQHASENEVVQFIDQLFNGLSPVAQMMALGKILKSTDNE